MFNLNLSDMLGLSSYARNKKLLKEYGVTHYSKRQDAMYVARLENRKLRPMSVQKLIEKQEGKLLMSKDMVSDTSNAVTLLDKYLEVLNEVSGSSLRASYGTMQGTERTAQYVGFIAVVPKEQETMRLAM